MEQLNHVQALLVEAMLHQHGWVESLIEMRRHYQGIIDDGASLASHAGEQLRHVNALLADQLVQQHEQQQVPLQASNVSKNPA